MTCILIDPKVIVDEWTEFMFSITVDLSRYLAVIS